MEHLELEDLSSDHSDLLNEKKITDTNKDTFINRTSINKSRYNGIYDSLLRYVDGIPIVVDYFKRNISYLEKRSAEVTFSLERSDVEYSFTHIHTMEMKLKEELTIEYNDETTETIIEGSALIYPGINPNIGDLFLFTLPNNLTGVFIINNVTRLSIQQGSHHEINFNLWNFLNTDIQEKIQANIIEHLYFSKQKYLSNDITLLRDESYNQLMTLKEYKDKLINLYMTKTYDDNLSSVSYKENDIIIYDPFIIEFLNYTLSFREKKKKIDQLCGNLIDMIYPYSLWKSIIEKDRFIMNYKNGVLIKGRFNIWNAGITSIANNAIMLITKQTDISNIKNFELYKQAQIDNYVFSQNFYDLIPLSDENINDDVYIENNFVEFDPFELFLMRFITNKSLDIKVLINDYLSKYPYINFSDKDNFYKIPIYIYLINFGIYKIS